MAAGAHDDEVVMAQPDAPRRQREESSPVTRLLPIAGGMALGALSAVLLITGGSRVPAEGLIGIGAFALLSGLAYSHQALWRGLTTPTSACCVLPGSGGCVRIPRRDGQHP